MYFAKDSESVEDWDDDSITEEDWENFTDDSSDVLSQYEGINDASSPAENREMRPLLDCNDQIGSTKLARHSSAPNISMLACYETPIIDHSEVKKNSAKSTSIRKKRVPNIMKLSFHG
jgi:hypothetical protein